MTSLIALRRSGRLSRSSTVPGRDGVELERGRHQALLARSGEQLLGPLEQVRERGHDLLDGGDRARRGDGCA